MYAQLGLERGLGWLLVRDCWGLMFGVWVGILLGCVFDSACCVVVWLGGFGRFGGFGVGAVWISWWLLGFGVGAVGC